MTILVGLLLAFAARAENLTGDISDPTLKRKVQIVYLEKVEGRFPPPAKAVVLNQRNNQYLPGLLPLVVGSKVSFQSEDPELHNVFARQGSKVLFNQGQPSKQVFEKAFTELGVVHLTCNIHKEMSAYLLILQNPFFVAPDAGAFTIQSVPRGTYSLRVWGEKLSDEQKAKKYPVTVGGAPSSVEISAT